MRFVFSVLFSGLMGSVIFAFASARFSGPSSKAPEWLEGTENFLLNIFMAYKRLFNGDSLSLIGSI